MKWQQELRLLPLLAPVPQEAHAEPLRREGLKQLKNAALACSKARRWDLALHLMVTPKAGATPFLGMKTCSAGISACGKATKWQTSLLLLHGCRAAVASKRKVPDTICFNSAIAACGEGSKWSLAFGILACMKLDRVTPDVVSLSATLTSCDRAAQWQKALTICDAVLEGSGHAWRVQPDLLLLTSAISACEKGQQWQWALTLLSRTILLGVDMDAVCFDTAMSACERSLQWESILCLFRQMSSFDVTPDAMSYVATVTAFSAAKKWQHCFQQLMGLGRRNFSANCFAVDAALRSMSSEPTPFRHVTSLLGRLSRKGLLELGLAEFILLASIMRSLASGEGLDWAMERQAVERVNTFVKILRPRELRLPANMQGLSDLGQLACCDFLEHGCFKVQDSRRKRKRQLGAR